MKINSDVILSRNEQRVLHDLSNTLVNKLTSKPFEKISVNELCNEANYPRSTFYNYFDDKFDLLDYCLSLLVARLDLKNNVKLELYDTLLTSFDQIYDLMQTEEPFLNQILSLNLADGYLQAVGIEYFRRTAHQIFEPVYTDKTRIPEQLVVEHCFSTVLIVIDWIFIKKHPLSKTDAHAYLRDLYGKAEFLV